MKRIFHLLPLLALLILGACGMPTAILERTPTPELSPTPVLDSPVQRLDLDSDPEAIRMMLLRSHTFWTTLFVDGVVKRGLSGEDGQQLQSFRNQIWIDQSRSLFRYISGPADGSATAFVASDGVGILTMDLQTGDSQITDLPGFAAAIRDYRPPESVTDTIYRHPLAGTIGSPFDDLILPSGLGQRAGTFQAVDMEIVAGRQTLIVDWFWPSGARSSRYWIDVETGVILKAQDFGKGGGDAVQSEYLVNTIIYDAVFGSHLFNLNPGQSPQFSDVDGIPLVVVTPAPAVPVGSDPLGDVYFLHSSLQRQEGLLLGRLPGSCVRGIIACPEAEMAALPGLWTGSGGLSWSPDGKKAAIALAMDESQVQYGLHIFDPLVGSWTSILEMPLMDLATWSADGDWIAVRVQDGQGSSDIYAVHPDGSGLVNLSASDVLPLEGHPYIMDGWITNNVIIRSGSPGHADSVYLVRATDLRVQSLFEMLMTKALLFPSPDGSLLAFDEYDYQTEKHTLRVIALDGSGLRDLASFGRSSIYPVVWSPDGNQLAFVVYAPGIGDRMTSDVYLMNRDGRGFQKVYSAETIAGLAFSPDGKILLLENTTPEWLVVVNLETLEYHRLQAPSLNMDGFLRMPSWRP